MKNLPNLLLPMPNSCFELLVPQVLIIRHLINSVIFRDESRFSLIFGSKCGDDAANAALIASPMGYQVLVEAV